MSHYAIHVPYDADKRFTANYEGVTDPMLGEPLSKPEINHASLVEGMDKSLGDILDFLDERPEVAQNTVIIFMSDNGGHSIAPVRDVSTTTRTIPPAQERDRLSKAVFMNP